MYIAAIIPAAGRGLRLRNRTSKPLIKIAGIPIITYTLKAITRHPFIKEVIVVANKSNIKIIQSIIEQYRIKKVSHIILGGKTRRDSVENGLKAIGNKTDFVLIHDAVRPFIPQSIISKVINEAKHFGAAIVGVPVKATIKKIKNHPPSPRLRGIVLRSSKSEGGQKSKIKIVEKTMDRSKLWEIQTPQVFRKDIILRAYNKFRNIKVTDEAALVERLGIKVKVVMGSYFNIKITTPEDLILAEAILKKTKN